MVKLTYNKLSGHCSATWCSQHYTSVLSHTFSSHTVLTDGMLHFLKVPVIIGRLDMFILQRNRVIFSSRKIEYLTHSCCRTSQLHAICTAVHSCIQLCSANQNHGCASDVTLIWPVSISQMDGSQITSFSYNMKEISENSWESSHKVLDHLNPS